MSTFDDLISELCPTGVNFRKLGEIAKRNSGTSITASKMKVLNSNLGPIKVFAAGNTFAMLRETSLPKKDVYFGPSIIVKSRGHIDFEYFETRFSHKSELWSYSFADKVSAKFLYYFLKTRVPDLRALAKSKSVKLPQLSVSDTDNLKVPQPPVEVQKEIVRILDTFTDLEAELEAELEARKKQYEYYRNSLIHEIVESSKIFTLGEVCQVFDGTHQTPNYVHQGIKFVSVENIKDLSGSNKYITEEDFYKLYKNKPSRGDLLMTRIGSVGDCALIDVDEPLAYYVSLALLKPNQMKLASGYLKFYLESSFGKRELYKRTLHQAVPLKINLGDISKLQIAVPSLEMQVSLIRKLEAFQATTESVTNGLPAEIVTRRKQYEYYRDKLLTFKELAA